MGYVEVTPRRDTTPQHQFDQNDPPYVPAHPIERGGLGVTSHSLHQPIDEDTDPGFVVDTHGPARPWVSHTVKQAVPLSVAVMLWGAAEAAHLAPLTWPIGAPAATAVYFVGAMATWTAWGRRNPDNREQRRRWARTVIVTGGAWLLWAATVGPGPLSTVLLTLGGAALAAPYWQRHARWTSDDDHDPEPEENIDFGEMPEVPALPVMEVVEQRTANQQHWDTLVGGLDGIGELRGSRLTDPFLTDQYETYTIQLVAGRQTSGSATGSRRKIASAYGRAATTIAIMPHPSGEEDKAQIRFSRDNPLANSFWYPSPAQALDLTGGNIRAIIGYHGDSSPVWWEFYRAGWGALGGGVFGDTGSGKSVLLQSLTTSAAYSGLIYPVVGCPQGGASFPMWIEHSDWSAPSADEILLQARGLLRAHTIRSMVNRLMKREIHVPTATEPMLAWILDELHKMRDHPHAAEFYRILDLLEREGRKTAIRAIIADQDPSVPKTFNGLMTIRRSLLSSQVVTLRLGSSVDSQLPGIEVNPKTLPKKFPDGTATSGLGALIGDPEAMRVARLRDAWDLARNAPKLTIEPAVANSMGPDYLERHTRSLEQDGDTAAQLEEFDPELVARIVADKPELAEAARLAKITRARRAAEDVTQRQAPTTIAASTGTTAVGMLNRPTGPRIVMPPIPTCVVPPPKKPEPATWTCVERVEHVMKDGVTAFGEIHDQARKPDGDKYSETRVRDALKELAARGLVEDGGHGHHVYRFRVA